MLLHFCGCLRSIHSSHADRGPSTVLLLGVATLALSGGCASGPRDWRQWGGPSRDFMVQARLAARWPEDGPRRLWRRELPTGYSSIVSDGQRLFTMYRDGSTDVVVALDAATGDTLFEHRTEAPTLEGQVLDFGQGPNATPLLLDDRIVTVGFTGKMNCLSTADGTVLWSHDLIRDFGGKVQEFGYAASPLLHDGNIIVLVGGQRNGVVAMHPSDGRVAWQSGPLDISYASPMVIEVDGHQQIVLFSSTEIIGVDANEGTKLWSWPCRNQYENNCSPAIWGPGNRLWVTTQQDGGTRMLQLKRRGGQTLVKELWSSNDIRCFHWNAVWVGDTLYASIGDTTTQLAAIDADSGRILWRERGFSKAKLLHASDKLILLDEDGRLGLARVTPQKPEILANVQLLEKVAWTPPTLVGTTLYVRDTTQIMALDLGG